MKKNELSKLSELLEFPASGLFYIAASPSPEQFTYHGISKHKPGYAIIHDGINFKSVPSDTIIKVI